MAKQVRPAHYYQQRNDPLRRIADRAIPGIKSDLKDALNGLAGLIPDAVDRHAAAGDWNAVKNGIDWGHFREVLKGVFGQIGKAREAGAQHGAQQINSSFASAGRKVRFRKAGHDVSDEPRDERGRWTTGGALPGGAKEIDQSSLQSRGWYLEGYHSNWLKNGEAVLLDVPVKNIVHHQQEYAERGPATDDKRVKEMLGSLRQGFRLPVVEGLPTHDGKFEVTDGNHRFVAWKIDHPDGTIPILVSSRMLKAFNPDVRKDSKYSFDLYSQDVQDQLRAAQDDLIVELEQDVRDAIDEIVLSGARLGLGPDEIMDDIRDMVGLTARQSQAAMNYRDMLENLDPGALQRQLRNFLEDDNVQAALDAGQPMDAAMVDKLTNDYIDNYIDYRAETIAQTEATRAVSLGLQDSYQQAIDRGVFPSEAVKQFWKVELDDVTCPICLSIPDMNPDGVAIDEAFDSIDGPQDAPPDPHPSCRCSIDIVTDLSMVDSDGVDAADAA